MVKFLLSIFLIALFSFTARAQSGACNVTMSAGINLSVCEGSDQDIIATDVNGIPIVQTVQYRWFKDAPAPIGSGAEITTDTDSILNLTNIQSADAGEYYILADYSSSTNNECAAKYNAALSGSDPATDIQPFVAKITLSVDVAPTAPTFASSQATVCQGENDVLFDVNTVTGATSYSWDYTGTGHTFDGGATTTGTSNTVDFSSSATSGTISVIATNSSNLPPCRNSAPGTVAVTVVTPPTIAATSGAGDYCVGENATLNATVSNQGSGTFSWKKDDAVYSHSLEDLSLSNLSLADAGTYKVFVNSTVCPDDSAEFAVGVFAAPSQPTFTSSVSDVCAGTSNVSYVVGTVTGADEYHWNYTGSNTTIDGGTTTATGTNSLSFASNATSGDVEVYATVTTNPAACQNSGTQTVAVTVEQAPSVVPTSGAGDYCVGENITLNATISNQGTATVSWDKDGNDLSFSAEDYSITNAQTTDAGTYKIKLNANSCPDDSAEFAVGVFAAPSQPTFTSSVSDVCAGTSNVSYVVGTVTGADEYHWNYTGSNTTIDGGTTTATGTNSLSFASNATSGDVEVYATVTTNPAACQNSGTQTVAVTVEQAPSVVPTSGAGDYCVGENITLNATISNQGTATVSWDKDGNDLSFSAEDYSITNAQTTDAGTYKIKLNANSCPDDSAEFAVGVFAAPSQPTFTSSVSDVCAGTSNVSYVVGTVTGADEYHWNYTGSNTTIDGGTTTATGANSLSFASNATSGDVEVYATVTTNPAACQNSGTQTVAVTVEQAPSVVPTSGAGDYCVGENITLNATISNQGTATVSWDKDGNDLSFSAEDYSITNAQTTDAGTYKIKLNANSCPDDSAEFAVGVFAAPSQPTFTSSVSDVCAGTSNVSYVVGTVTGADEYHWNYTGSNTTIDGGTTTATGANSLSFASNATSGDVEVYATVTTNPAACQNSGTQTVAVTVEQAPTATIAAQFVLCEGSNASLNANVSNQQSIEWMKESTTLSDAGTVSGTSTATLVINPLALTDAGNYTVTAKGNVCPDSSMTTTVVVPADNESNTASICPGATAVTLDAGTPMGGNYQWATSVIRAGNEIASETASTYTTSTIGSYYFHYDSVGTVETCNLYKEFVVSSGSMVTQMFDMTDSIYHHCQGTTAEVATTLSTISGFDMDSVQFSWSTFVGDFTTATVAINGKPQNLSIDTSGYYRVQVDTIINGLPGGCAIFDSAQVIIERAAAISLSTDKDRICNDESLTLIATTTVDDLSNQMVKWVLNNDTLAATSNSLEFMLDGAAQPVGSYTIQALMEPQDTVCSPVAETVTVEIINCTLFIPNVFSPNGDGINDQFMVEYEGVEDYKISIYNRWGVLMFETTDASNLWTGDNAAEGTYYWEVKVGDTIQKGWLSLMR